ncbi:MAG: 1-acyl-sn-glycerol-3-phosphate acyltransferase [Deltaproteobacteria bacterium]|nr:1-acyl-sn-glycerol-3-phosphate acyltransferase [Deltaproteobacteria bacterium]
MAVRIFNYILFSILFFVVVLTSPARVDAGVRNFCSNVMLSLATAKKVFHPEEVPFDAKELLTMPELPNRVAKIVQRLAPILPPAHGLMKAALWAKHQEVDHPTDIFAEMLKWLNVKVNYKPEQLERIPKTGPVLVVINHPMGLIDGVMVGDLISKIRQDFQIMTLTILQKAAEADPRFNDHLVYVIRKAKTKEEKDWNAKVLLKVVRKLKKQGGLQVIFPSGSVSVKKDGRLEDPEWEENMIDVARLSGAQILPMFVHGENSSAYYQIQKIHPSLRRLFYARNLFNKGGQKFNIEIGEPMTVDQLYGVTAKERTESLRKVIYQLGEPTSVFDQYLEELSPGLE